MISRRKKRENRIIIHIDMIHFFTAIEEREHPEYKGQPIVVGADQKMGREGESSAHATMNQENLESSLGCPFPRLGNAAVQQSIYQSTSNFMEEFPQESCLSSESMQTSLSNSV